MFFFYAQIQMKTAEKMLSDYKEGKAYSYFDSGWLGEVQYHPISIQGV